VNDNSFETLCESLAGRQLANGGWSALSSSQAALEATALACMALSCASHTVQHRAIKFLLDVQNPNGSWPAFLGDDRDGSWTTSIVAIALGQETEAIPQLLKGFTWLVDLAGKESNWLWRWKFRTSDRHVRFDPDKFGWPWVPGTNSWVVPTAFAILALNQIPCDCGFEGRVRRIELGIDMLLDRACPGGGWNAGNGLVYGMPMAPHPDDTAIALLALSRCAREPVVTASLDWLESMAPTVNAVWSLAWCILALAAHQRSFHPLVQRILEWPNLVEIGDTATLAVTCLALDYKQTLTCFGLTE